MRRHTRLSTMPILAATLIAAVSSARAAESIVGTWAPDPMDCTPVGGMVAIGPLSLTSDELACTFATVSRTGDVVIWHGRCSTGAVTPKPAAVTAALRGGVLAITINGIPSVSLRRCRVH